MPISSHSGKLSRLFVAGRIAGFCIYILAFFLPAVKQVTTFGGTPDVYKGWFCAWVTLVNSFSHEVWHSKECLAILSGWINPLILLYLVFLMWRKLVWPRRVVAAVVVLFMAATWVYFAFAHMVPLIGHMLWIVGALMILAGEAAGCCGAPDGAE